MQRNHLKKIALQGFTTDISHYLQEARRYFPSLQVLKLSGAVTDETVCEITHFKHLKHLEIRNTLSGTAVKPCTEVSIGSLVFGALEVLVLEQIFALTINSLNTLLLQVPKLHYLELIACQNSGTGNFTMDQIDQLHKSYRSRLTIRYLYYDSQRRICSILFPKSDG